MRGVDDLEHWRDFVRVDPVGPGGLKPRGRGKAALLTYIGDKHPSWRRVIGAELTRHQAENLCAAIMACFEEPEPSQEEFLYEPEEEAVLEWIAGLAGGGWHLGRRVSKICLQFLLTSCRAEPGIVCSDCTREADRLGLTIPPLPEPQPEWPRVPKCPMGYELPCRWNEDGGDCETCAFGVPAGYREPVHSEDEAPDETEAVRKIIRDTTHLGECFSSEDEERLLRWAHGRTDPDEPYWRKSFTVTPPPEGLEGGLAETAVVVQAKHGGPVPLTREQAEEFVDSLLRLAVLRPTRAAAEPDEKLHFCPPWVGFRYREDE